jgi:hypothetical protein
MDLFFFEIKFMGGGWKMVAWWRYCPGEEKKTWHRVGTKREIGVYKKPPGWGGW